MNTNLKPPGQLLSIALVAVLVFQCHPTDVSLKTEQQTPYSVSSTQAIEVAANYITNLKESGNASVANGRKAPLDELTSTETIVGEDKQPLFHIINRKKGFTIVSADLRAMPVLAFSDESKFDTKNIPLGVSFWFDDAKAKIKDIKKTNKNADSIVIKEWKKYLSGNLTLPTKGARRSTNCYEWYQYGQYMCQGNFVTTGPLLTTNWGQKELSTTAQTLNIKNCDGCGRYKAGCGPVAMAQVYEFHHPSSKPRTSWGSCTASNSDEIALGQLMLSCKNASNSDFDYMASCFTMTWPSNIPTGFSLLGFSNGGTESAGYNYSIIRSELLANKPLIFWGSTCLTCFQNYHIWVADGLQENTYREFSCETLQCTEWAYSYVHMNWGWDGDYNGWYAFGQYNPNGNNFNANLHIISGIRP